MLAVLENVPPRERRRLKCWKKARRRLQYASSYLAMLSTKDKWMDQQEERLIVEDVEELLSDALKYVRMGRRIERKVPYVATNAEATNRR